MELTSRPDSAEALQFALMLNSGLPSLDAIRYFYLDELDRERLKFEQDRWLRSPVVQKAILSVQGKSWQEMDLETRISFAVNKHYSELAYYLYSHNYSELDGAARQKADTCRSALEAKLAGMAGKMDPLSKWMADMVAQRAKPMAISTIPS